MVSRWQKVVLALLCVCVCEMTLRKATADSAIYISRNESAWRPLLSLCISDLLPAMSVADGVINWRVCNKTAAIAAAVQRFVHLLPYLLILLHHYGMPFVFF